MFAPSAPTPAARQSAGRSSPEPVAAASSIGRPLRHGADRQEQPRSEQDQLPGHDRGAQAAGRTPREHGNEHESSERRRHPRRQAAYEQRKHHDEDDRSDTQERRIAHPWRRSGHEAHAQGAPVQHPEQQGRHDHRHRRRAEQPHERREPVPRHPSWPRDRIETWIPFASSSPPPRPPRHERVRPERAERGRRSKLSRLSEPPPMELFP